MLASNRRFKGKVEIGGKMRSDSRYLLRVVSFPLIIGCLLLLGCEEKQETVEIVRPVETMTVQDVKGFAKRYFPGRSAATQEINASFRVAGQLIKRPIEVGDEIKKNDLIAALDPSTFQVDVDRLTADVSSSNALLKRSRLELDRQQTLLSKGWVTKARVETIDATNSAARADLLAAQAGLKRARLDLSYTALTAPFDGVVVDIYVENFQEVLAKQPIARIVDTSQIEFWISIPENLISLAPYVRDLRVEFDAFPGQLLPAEIKEIKNEASETTRAYDVNLIMDQPDGITVLPGMAGRATAGRYDLPEAEQIQGYEIPLTAIHNPDGDKEYLWVVDEGSMTVSRREIETVEITARGIRVDGVEPGEHIVIAGVEYLREGQKVRIRPLNGY